MSDSKWNSHWEECVVAPYSNCTYASQDSIDTNLLAENYTIEYLYNQMKELCHMEADKKIISNIIPYPIEVEYNFDFGDYHNYIKYNCPKTINWMYSIIYPDVLYDVPQVDDEEDRGGLRYI